MATSIQVLSQMPVFALLGEETLQAIAADVHEQCCWPGQLVILEGEPCRTVYFVVRGLLRTSRLSLEGRQAVLGYLRSGEPLNLIPAAGLRSQPSHRRRSDPQHRLRNQLWALPRHRPTSPRGNARFVGAPGG